MILLIWYISNDVDHRFINMLLLVWHIPNDVGTKLGIDVVHHRFVNSLGQILLIWYISNDVRRHQKFGVGHHRVVDRDSLGAVSLAHENDDESGANTQK